VSSGTPGTGNVQLTYSGGTTYTPGQGGTFTVTITDPNAQRWGFEASPRTSSNAQAGTIEAGPGTQVLNANSLQYVTHNPAKMGASPGTFEFNWTPPAEAAGEITVYVAANAANGNGQNTGDTIYTSNLKLTAAQAGGSLPSISEGGVADAFTYQRGVASGAWIAIFGQNLASTTRNWDGSPEFGQNMLPLSLDGVSVTINDKPAPVFFISSGQVNVLAPLDDATGDVRIVVKNANGESTPVTAQKSAFLPALYAPFGQNDRLFVTGVENATGAILGKRGVDSRATRAFRPGDVVQFYATGLGPTNPSVPVDQVVSQPAQVVETVEMHIDQTEVEVLGAVLQASGLYQINARIPDVPDGDHTIRIKVGGAESAENVSIAIQRAPATGSAPASDPSTGYSY
jgi:uncharacterized protein (TIGR03437 family)